MIFIFLMIFFISIFSESPLVLVFCLIGLSGGLSFSIFILGLPMLCYMWVLVYIGGMMIVFTYVVFFSLNSWMSHDSPPKGNFYACIIFLSGGSKMSYSPPLGGGSGSSFMDLILSIEMSWSVILFIFLLMGGLLNLIIQMITKTSPHLKLQAF